MKEEKEEKEKEEEEKEEVEQVLLNKQANINKRTPDIFVCNCFSVLEIRLVRGIETMMISRPARQDTPNCCHKKYIANAI